MADENTPWFSGLDDATRGTITTRQWDKLEAPAAVAEAVKVIADAEAKLGAPASEMVRVPKGADDPTYASFWERLGAPKDATGYDFSEVKAKDGSAAPAEITDTVRAVAARLRLPVSTAAEIARDLVASGEKRAADEAERVVAAVASAKAMLKTSWGADEPVQTYRANRALEHFGISPDHVAQVFGTNADGYVKFMQNFASLGARMMEAKLLGGENPAGGGPSSYTPEQAAARKASLLRDADFLARWTGPDATKRMAAADELRALDSITIAARMGQR